MLAMPVIGFLHLRRSKRSSLILPPSTAAWAIQASSRVKTLRSNTGGDKVKTVGCQRYVAELVRLQASRPLSARYADSSRTSRHVRAG